MASLRLQAALLGLVLALGLGLAPTVAASIPDTQGIADGLLSRLSEPSPELDVSEPVRVTGDGASLPETRVRGFRLFDPLSRPGYNGVSRGNATRSTFGLWGNRVGPVQKGLWTDPVTGAAYARARWYDAGNGVFLTEDPMGAVDSSNLYAFGAWAPSMHTDPTGEFVPQLLGGVASVGIGWGVSKLCEWMVKDEEAKEDCRYSKEDAAVDFALGAATMGLSNISKLRHVSKLGAVGRVGVRATAEIGLDVGAEVTRRELKGEDWTLGEVTVGAGRNFLVGEAGAAVGRQGFRIVKAQGESLLKKNSGGRSWWRWQRDVQEADAAEAYEAIRQSSTDVAAISRYTGFKRHRLERIKDYVFNSGFDPDPEIANAWHRLRTGQKYDLDILLLKHETAEMYLRGRGYDYSPAHRRANKHWNWQEEIEAILMKQGFQKEP